MNNSKLKWNILYATVLIVLVAEVIFFIWLTNRFK